MQPVPRHKTVNPRPEIITTSSMKKDFSDSPSPQADLSAHTPMMQQYPGVTFQPSTTLKLRPAKRQ